MSEKQPEKAKGVNCADSPQTFCIATKSGYAVVAAGAIFTSKGGCHSLLQFQLP